MLLVLLAIGDVPHDGRKTREPATRGVHWRDVDGDLHLLAVLAYTHAIVAQLLAAAKFGVLLVKSSLVLAAMKDARGLSDDLVGTISEERFRARIPCLDDAIRRQRHDRIEGELHDGSKLGIHLGGLLEVCHVI